MQQNIANTSHNLFSLQTVSLRRRTYGAFDVCIGLTNVYMHLICNVYNICICNGMRIRKQIRFQLCRRMNDSKCVERVRT
jgi:hypothetical protein